MSTKPVGAHLVGSVPLGGAEEVFLTTSEVLGGRLKRIPDGETGDRLGWIHILLPVLAGSDALELRTRTIEGLEEYGDAQEFFLRDGASADDVDLSGIGYKSFAEESYAVFSRLKRDGSLPAETRFQVSLPTPGAAVSFVGHDSKAAMEEAFREAIFRDLKEITELVPADELAIQWDVCAEPLILTGALGFAAHYDDAWDGTIERLARCVDAVPEGVQAGMHTCVGDWGHQHQVELDDCDVHVRLLNDTVAAASRSLDFVQVPIHRERDTASYCAPLANLKLAPETELYLGLVHMTDGVAGTQKRIDAASAVVDSFGVATECGFGRRPPETVRPLLEVHAAVSDPHPSLATTS